ncbi:hypothetical protein ABT364_24930 [Massilia sp. SR12]
MDLSHEVTCIGSTLLILPLLLVAVFLVLGRRRRVKEIRSYVENPSASGMLIPPQDGVPDSTTNESLAEHLVGKYNETHSGWAFFYTMLVFYAVYGVLVYWTFSSWGRMLGQPDNTQEIALWPLIRLGGLGALGATLGVLWHLHWRVVRLDLQPKTLLQLSARLFISPFLAIALAAMLPSNSTTGYLVAFGAGLFGEAAWRRFALFWREQVQQEASKDGSLSLELIQGITRDDAMRLWEEGINDVQHLAVETVVHLVTNTNYSLARIVDWKDQAYFCVYVRDQVDVWRRNYTRGVLDVLGMHSNYFGKAQCEALMTSLAQVLGQDRDVICRFVDTINNDPQVHQLWDYAKSCYPAKVAESIHQKGQESAAAGCDETPGPVK